MKNVAVILSGCGYLDGTEIREAIAALWALAQHDVHASRPVDDAGGHA